MERNEILFQRRARTTGEPVLRGSHVFLALAVGGTSTAPKGKFEHESSPLQPEKVRTSNIEEE